MLAGHEREAPYGVEFVTWERVQNRTSLWQGHYHDNNYADARQEFAVRAGLVSQDQLFSAEQLTEIYRSVQDTLDNNGSLTTEQETWAVPSPGHLPLDAVIFDGKIDVLPGRLSFQLDPEAWFDSLDAVFGANTCTEGNNDFLTVRACYDSGTQEVCGELDVVWHREEGAAERLAYPLNDVERACVGRRMEEYCRQQTGMELAAYGAQAEQSYFASRPEPLTDFDAMALYAGMCVAEMADKIYGELQHTDVPDHAAEASQEHGAGPVMGGIQ